jgi:hypothetical protein
MARPTVIYPGVTVSGGGGGGGSEYLSFSNATEIGSSGKIADGASDSIELTIDSGQAAAVASSGLAGLIGAAVWNLGAVSTGNINSLVEWVSIINKTHVCVAVWRAASAPTSLADIKAANTRWLQVLTQGGGTNTSTYVKTNTNNLATSNRENLASSVSVSFTVATDADGYGRALSRHDSSGTSSVQSSSSAQAEASGDFYLALLWGKTATAAGLETIKLKLQGEFLQ